MDDNFSALADMTYSGRGITIGMTPSGKPFFGYSLTGRSPPSQARELLETESGIVRINVTDPELIGEGEVPLLVYPTIVPYTDVIFGSNGRQILLIYDTMNFAKGFSEVDLEYLPLSAILRDAFSSPSFEYDQTQDRWIDLTTYEPDSPNYTPRISGLVRGGRGSMHIVRNPSGEKDEEKEADFFDISLEPGTGRTITTYRGGNESPLLPFLVDPLEVGIESEHSRDIAESLYEAIHGGENSGDNYRVAVAVVMQKSDGNFDTYIINRSERGD